ncbi:MAG: hypothetical protein MSA07_06430 [Mucispirillum sp.]|uniref:Uncharacterized protein n=1 Tax=Candidatus Mucispirillum faecigallinarum TaxID=2838699 RepID=A0A9D2GTX9_9BACT|nr:hypothetical protein [Mucispirillum sp.]HIZ89309.1 hypothetical protein [Candidatus Mucispirillum faecigallinarum]
MADRPKDHVYVEEGELRKMRDPRTGQIKEVDLSLPALSRTMENIRKSAELINQPNVSFEMAMGRFEYIKELVLDSAQFSPRLQNLQIKILNKNIEVVKNIEELEEAKVAYAKQYYMKEAKNILAKTDRKSGFQRVDALQKAIELLIKGKKIVGDDEEYNQYIVALRKELMEHHKSASNLTKGI